MSAGFWERHVPRGEWGQFYTTLTRDCHFKSHYPPSINSEILAGTAARKSEWPCLRNAFMLFCPFQVTSTGCDRQWPDINYKHGNSMWLSGNLWHLLKFPHSATYSLQRQGLLSLYACLPIPARFSLAGPASESVFMGPEAGHKRRHFACGDFCMQVPELDLTQLCLQHLHSLDLGVKGKAQTVSWHFLCTFCELLKDGNWLFLLQSDFTHAFISEGLSVPDGLLRESLMLVLNKLLCGRGRKALSPNTWEPSPVLRACHSVSLIWKF